MTDAAQPPLVNHATWSRLSPEVAYGILRLRSLVFVVEQDCVYLDPDGRDLEPQSEQLWIEQGGEVVAALRVVSDGEARRIGRVATHPQHRGRGFAARLVRRSVELGDAPLVLAAQQQLVGWYQTLGFVVDGESWSEQGIVHVPMRLNAPR